MDVIEKSLWLVSCTDDDFVTVEKFMQKNWSLLIAIKFKKVTYTWARTEHAILNREGRRYTWLRFSVFYIFFKMILIHVQFERRALSIYKQLFIFYVATSKSCIR